MVATGTTSGQTEPSRTLPRSEKRRGTRPDQSVVRCTSYRRCDFFWHSDRSASSTGKRASRGKSLKHQWRISLYGPEIIQREFKLSIRASRQRANARGKTCKCSEERHRTCCTQINPIFPAAVNRHLCPPADGELDPRMKGDIADTVP